MMMKFTSSSRQTLRIAIFAALLAIGSFVAAGYGQDDQQKESKAPQVITQGGYVEKVGPNVDYKDRLPRIPPREPAESMTGFHIVPGFRIEQVAAEPMVRDAVDMAFDEDGRMFVVEMISYAEGNTSKFGSPTGRVSLLEDTDGDGRFDTSRVYIDQLVWPTAVTCFDGGIFVAAAPDLADAPDGTLYLADMYREMFEHPDAVPPSAKKYLDLTAGNDRGRVYRIVPEGFKQPKPPRLGKMSTGELVALLSHPNGWHRTTAARCSFCKSLCSPRRAV